MRELSSSTTQSVNKFSERDKRPKRETSSKQLSKPETPREKQHNCLSCGKAGHKRTNCKYKNSVCHSCNKKGHISPACLSKSTKQIMRAEETLHRDHEAIIQPDSFTTSLYKVDEHGIKVNVELNGVSLPMELDTGAGASLISEETYRKHLTQ